MPFKQKVFIINLLKIQSTFRIVKSYLQVAVPIYKIRNRKSSLVKCSKLRPFEQITNQELESCGFKPFTPTKVF